MIFHIINILWNSAFVILPFVIGKFGAKDEIKKTNKKLDILTTLRIYGQGIITPLIMIVFMYGGSSINEENKIKLDMLEIGAAFVIGLVSSFIACFTEIYKHNSKVESP